MNLATKVDDVVCQQMQLLILIITLSIAVHYDRKGFNEDEFLKELLEREIKAEYKLENLLKKD